MERAEQHIHTLFFAPILDHAFELIGAERTRAVLARVGTDEALLRDPSAWVSSQLADDVADALVVESGDPDMIAEAGRKLFTGSYLGAMKPILQIFGSPRKMFAQFPAASPRWNKVGSWEIQDIGDDHVDISYACGVEGSVQMCKGRLSQLGALPVMFGLAPAQVEHPECLHRGDARCRYQLTWELPQDGLAILLPRLAVGGLGLGLVALMLGAAWTVVAAASALGGVIGALVARSTRLSQQLDLRAARLAEQDTALHRSLEATEVRFAELLEAKRDVDRQVDARTQELQQTSAKLADALVEVQELDELKTRFFANVSHELRTPLQLILGPLDELVHGIVPPDRTAARLRVMSRNAHRLHRLINQILDLARADAGQAQVDRVAVQLSTLVAQVVGAFSTAAEAHGQTLTAEIVDDVVAKVDPNWLESALTNLVANALRHCDAGDSVTVRVAVVGPDLRLEVQDTGPGIPQADLPRLFDRFVQSVQKEGGPRGSGLGLAIVREAARLHRGDVFVDSTVGQGTTFRLQMPFEPAIDAVELAPIGPDLAPTRADDAPVTVIDGPGPNAPLVVVAEDEPDLRAYVASTLSARFRVVACANGQLALEQITRRLPDLVVTDRTMPELSGTELCQRLRASPDTARIPVLLLTAHQTPDDVVAGYDAGADDYVGKPFHPRELLARAEVHLRLRRLGQEAVVRERMASIGMLSAEIAHHFRNPLNFLKSGLQVVQRQVDPVWMTEHARFWETLVESSSRIELLTSDLLRLARGHRQAAYEMMHPADSLRSAVRLTEATLPPDVHLEVGSIEAVRIRGRTGDLNQVVLNLLDNANRALDGEGTIRVGAHRDGDDYVIVVEDSGPGIAEDLQEHLFEAFVSTRAHGEGSGLGLAIAAKVVQDHGGTIDVSRSPSLGGARFRIRLPAADPGDKV